MKKLIRYIKYLKLFKAEAKRVNDIITRNYRNNSMFPASMGFTNLKVKTYFYFGYNPDKPKRLCIVYKSIQGNGIMTSFVSIQQFFLNQNV